MADVAPTELAIMSWAEVLQRCRAAGAANQHGLRPFFPAPNLQKAGDRMFLVNYRVLSCSNRRPLLGFGLRP